MTRLILLACLLACPIGMGLMMWFMSKGLGRSRSAGSPRERGEPDG